MNYNVTIETEITPVRLAVLTGYKNTQQYVINIVWLCGLLLFQIV